MAEIRNVKLELLRQGPAHNQLLSPLTPYLALCGGTGGVTVNMPFEHRHLLAKLERLSYSTEGTSIATSQRETELRELGEAIGRVFAQVPALLTELGNARSDLVHLRLSMAASELALLPFELAIGSDSFPGSGSPLFVQSIAPITVTREVRRGQPLPVVWNRKPRILFAFASPRGLDEVPAQAHLEALRRAIEPWVNWRQQPEERVQQVKSILTVLPNASLQQIRRACAETDYTHVHILAHGDRIGTDEERRYGIALCADAEGSKKDVVDGEALAIALTARDSTGGTRFRPTLVSLATCDSGHQGSVSMPDGSLAYALHAGGMPWVVASQFPLWMRGSTIVVEDLYKGLLRGDDPRWVLYTLRQRLRTNSPNTHDWASIMVYAVIPWDFEQQLQGFRNRQTRAAIEMKFDKAEEILKQANVGTTATKLSPGVIQPEQVYEAIRADLRKWRAESAGATRFERAERLGISAASEKRIGNLHQHQFLLASDDNEKQKHQRLAQQAYTTALKLYKDALQIDPKNHWVITQYLSLTAVMTQSSANGSLRELHNDCWLAARWLAAQELRSATGEQRAWALGTLAELELLGTVYASLFDTVKAKEIIVKYCAEICDAVGSDAFAVFSTRRQFERYLRFWPRDSWKDLAAAAFENLESGESWIGREYLG